jgi:hypothetical protein
VNIEDKIDRLTEVLASPNKVDHITIPVVNTDELTAEEQEILDANWAYAEHLVDDMVRIFADHADLNGCTNPACVSGEFVAAMVTLGENDLLAIALHAAVARLHNLKKKESK